MKIHEIGHNQEELGQNLGQILDQKCFLVKLEILMKVTKVVTKNLFKKKRPAIFKIRFGAFFVIFCSL